MSSVEALLVDVDQRWNGASTERVPLKILGASALLIQHEYDRVTTDSDILETLEISQATKDALLVLAGPGTRLAEQHRVYLQFVPNGLPFLRQRAVWNPLEPLNAQLSHFSVFVLDVVDVVVAKLKRFSANDRKDIEAMIDLGHVAREDLVAAFREAADYFAYDARADDLPTYVKNLHTVERDMFDVDETEIELPEWIG